MHVFGRMDPAPRGLVNYRGAVAVAAVPKVHTVRLPSFASWFPKSSGGYLSAEESLLDGWEYLIKRMMMTDISDQVREPAEGINALLRSDDVQA